MEIKDLINKLIAEKNLKKTDFYNKIEMSGKGYLQMLENNSMKVSMLLKIADILEVSPAYLLGEPEKPVKENAEILELLRENRELRKRIDRLKETFNLSSLGSTPEVSAIKKVK